MHLLRKRAPVLLVLALAILVAGMALEAVRRHALYWYDVRQDYAYSFSAGTSKSFQVVVSNDGFVLPDWNGGRRTALLKLRVSSGILGWWFDPCLEIVTTAGPDRQCFDRGGKGYRYVLLPPTVATPGRHVVLTGIHLDWEEQVAELILFEAHDLRDSRILVLAPHPDDAEIAAFGLYSGHESFIVTITAGNYVDGLYSRLYREGSDQDRLRGTVRTWDSQAVPLWGGVTPERLASLGYPTYSLQAYYEAARAGTAVPEGLRVVQESFRQGATQTLLGGRRPGADWESVVADLVEAISSIRPKVIVTPHPAMDDHTDHQFTTIALLEALDQLQDQTTILLLYNNHHVFAEHYPFGPSEARVTLPPWFSDVEFVSIYSNEVDSATQMRKLFALEAMHDLRGPPLRLSGGPFGVLIDRLKQAYDIVRRDPFGDYSYFRRAVRPNELFFVYGPGDRQLINTIGTAPAEPLLMDQDLQ